MNDSGAGHVPAWHICLVVTHLSIFRMAVRTIKTTQCLQLCNGYKEMVLVGLQAARVGAQ